MIAHLCKHYCDEQLYIHVRIYLLQKIEFEQLLVIESFGGDVVCGKSNKYLFAN